MKSPAFSPTASCNRDNLRINNHLEKNGPGPDGSRGSDISAYFTPATLRNCAHFPSKISVNLSKNPVNLSDFSGILKRVGEVFRGAVAVLWGSCVVSWSSPHSETLNARTFHPSGDKSPPASGRFTRRGPWCILGERADSARRANAGKCVWSRPGRGLLKKPPPQGIKATPPTPPCQGGIKRRCAFAGLRGF